MKATVNLIMVTWNAFEYTKLTLNSLKENTKYTDYVLTIIDNASTDGTQEFLEELKKSKRFNKLIVVLNKSNVGYGGAILQGSKLVESKYVCALNNDLLFSNGWLEAMITEMENNPSLGLLGPLRPAPFCNHPYTKDNTNIVIEAISNDLSIKEELNKYTFDTEFNIFVEDLLNSNQGSLIEFTGPPIHIVGCCFLVNMGIAEKSGGIIDPQFPLGCEDTDLSWRISTNGYKIGVTKKTYVHHFKHKSFNKRFETNKNERLEMYSKINKLFYKKWSNEIKKFINNQLAKGIDVDRLMNDEGDYKYWFLRRLNENIGFWEEGKLINVTI